MSEQLREPGTTSGLPGGERESVGGALDGRHVVPELGPGLGSALGPALGEPKAHGRVSRSDFKIVDLARSNQLRKTAPEVPAPAPAGFLHLQEGAWDPSAGRRVEVLIAKLSDRVVYLDPDLFVQWDHEGGSLPDGAMRVLNRVAAMESAPIDFLPLAQRRTYRRLLGQAVARLIVDESVEQAQAALDAADSFLHARRRERSRFWYLGTMLIGAAGLILVGGVGWLCRGVLGTALGEPGFIGVLCAVAGGLGGFASVVQRLARLRLEPAAGRELHSLDCLMRLSVSMLAAAIVCVAIHAGAALFRSPPVVPLQVLLLACTLAGFLERLVPSLFAGDDSDTASPSTSV